MTLVREIEKSQMKSKIAQVKVGDTIRVHQRIEEGGKERIQAFEGTVISFKEKNNPRATIRVRRIASGIGVEKTFLLHSPWLEKIEVIRGGKARRAKLYYMREMVGKAAQKLKEKERENHVWEQDKVTNVAEETKTEGEKEEPVKEETKGSEEKKPSSAKASEGQEVEQEIEKATDLPSEKAEEKQGASDELNKSEKTEKSEEQEKEKN